MVEDHSDSERKPTTTTTWVTFRLASSQRQDSTYHDLCYASHGVLAGREINKRKLSFVIITDFVFYGF